MKLYKLGYADKIHKRKNFELILQQGEKHSSKNLTVFIYPNTKSRLGLIISHKKVHLTSNVQRNRLKRRLREIFRLKRHQFIRSSDVVIMPRLNAASLKYQQLEEEFLTLMKKCGLMV